MAEPHPVASHYLPSFITAPGESDVLMVATGLFLALAVVMFGVLFLRLHSLPEHMAHKSHKMQAEIVAVLCLIGLFTHMHIFWVAALLLAMIDIPDFGGSLGRIADSTETLAGRRSRQSAADLPPETMADAGQSNVAVPREARGMIAALARWCRRVFSSIVGRQAREGAAELPPETMAGVKKTDAHEAIEKQGEAKRGNGAMSTKPDFPQESPFDPHSSVPPRRVKGS
jgi:hypothetical protein